MEKSQDEMKHLHLRHIDEAAIDETAAQVALKLSKLTDNLGYEEDRRTAHVENFMHRSLKRNEVSIADYTAHALALLSNRMINESDLEEFYSQSGVFSLKRTLLLVEALIDRVEPNPEHEDELEDFLPMFLLSDVVARQLSYRGEEKFVDLHYSGVDFQTETTKE